MNQTQKQPLAKNNENTWLLILMIVSLVTMAVHAYLTLQHYQLKLGLAEGRSVCNLNATFNCDSVAISKYSALFGIPMALLGLLSQIVFFIALFTVRFDLSTKIAWLRRFLFWFSCFVFATSVVMGLISTFALGTFCLFCMATYLLSIVQLIGAWKIQPQSPFSFLSSDIGTLLMEARWVLVLLVLIPGIGWMSNAMILDSYGFGRIQVAIQDSLAQWDAAPTQNFQEDRGLSLTRSAGPVKMTIVEFADFLCPHCKAASPTLEAFTQSHPDVKLIFKTFPLDGKCNKAISRAGDGLRCQLAAAVVCAQNQGQKGWEAHHWIFERQEQFHTTTFSNVSDQIVKDLHLDKPSFDTCLNADATQETIQSMAQEGASIPGTPTIFVNGKVLERGQALPVLEALYQKLSH
jgi:protein-disulfide isomerase/uncharacterized membrane protein